MSKQATYAEIKDGVVINVEVLTIEQIETMVDQNLLDSVIRMGDGDPAPANGTPAGEVVSSGTGTYAFIKKGVVISVVRAGSDFIQQQTDAGNIDSAVFLGSDDPTPNVGDTYDGINFIPFVPPLDVAISQKLAAFKAALTVFGQSHYDTQTQLNFIALYLAAQANGLVNRAAYIGQLLTWLNQITVYAAQFAMQVSTNPDASQVVAMQWDFTQLPPDPVVMLGHAIQIEN
jgi:hypothetical protein